MKGVRFLFALCAAMVLGGCGDSIKSPAFSEQLLSLELSTTEAAVPLGTTQQLVLDGEFSQQPGVSPVTRPVAEASYTVVPASVATVDSSGLLTATEQGTATVTASVDGVTSNSLTITVGPAKLTSIVVRTVAPDGTVGSSGDVSRPAGSIQTFKALGIYTDSAEPQELGGDVSVVWESSKPEVASLSTASGVQTTARALDLGFSDIKATATSSTVGPFEAVGRLTVSTSALVELVRLEPSPPPAAVAAGQSKQFIVIGRFADNSTGPIDTALYPVDWSSADQAIATVDTTGLATGVAFGNTTITATLKPEVSISGTTRSVSATLSVGNAACTSPLLQANGAKVEVEATPLCVGCTFRNAGRVIDNDLTNSANLDVLVSLLSANVSLTVSAAEGTTFDASTASPRRVGFIIGRHSQLLTLALLRGFEVSTLLDGTVKETRLPEGRDLLDLDLLGLLGGEQVSLLSFEATQPYDAIRLTYRGGVASVLPTALVFGGCALAEQPE